MSDLRKAAEMALDALDMYREHDAENIGLADAAYEALRQALAQPEQEPVAYVTIEPALDGDWRKCPSIKWFKKPTEGPLYTAPPKREWVGLTDDEIKSCNEFTTDWGQSAVWLWDDDFEEGGIQFARALETKLKEKNT
jgi:hypothetical protein